MSIWTRTGPGAQGYPGAQQGAGHRRAPAPHGLPVEPGHLGAGHRRPQRTHPGERVERTTWTSKGLAKTDQAAKVGELVAERAKAAGIEQVVFDRGSVPVSRSSQGSGRRCPPGRPGLLRKRGKHCGADKGRCAESSGERDRHQPRGQGGQGRPALLVHGSRGRGRRRERGRRRLRQGERSPVGHPEGHRGRQARTCSWCPSTAAPSPTRSSVITAPAECCCALPRPVPASSPAAACGRCSSWAASRTSSPSAWGPPTPSTWCGRPSKVFAAAPPRGHRRLRGKTIREVLGVERPAAAEAAPAAAGTGE